MLYADLSDLYAFMKVIIPLSRMRANPKKKRNAFHETWLNGHQFSRL